MVATASAAPVTNNERIFTLDMLRGIAVLGILLMNIGIFAQPWAIGNNPSILNESGTINYYLWFIISWIFDGTQRAIFSLLFGAGIILFVTRQEKKFSGLTPADYFFRRQLWLILFSLIDVYVLLWEGDILLDYALFGMLLFVFRTWSPRALIIAAGVCVLLMVGRENRGLYTQKAMIQEGEMLAARDTSHTKLTSLEKAAVDEMNTLRSKSGRESILKYIENTRQKVIQSYSSVYEYRTGGYVNGLVTFIYFGLWDVLTFMFLGMAFFKLGILTGTAQTKTYAWMCILGLGIGLPLSWLRMRYHIINDYNDFNYFKNVPFSFYELTRMPRAIGIIGLIMLLNKTNSFRFILQVFRPVGQMAFTNYLMQSLICGIIFNAYGFKLFGQLQRYEIYLVVLAIWSAQIIYSHIWMRYFLFGPFEWAWRSLTYWKRQPFVKRVTSEQNPVIA